MTNKRKLRLIVIPCSIVAIATASIFIGIRWHEDRATRWQLTRLWGLYNFGQQSEYGMPFGTKGVDINVRPAWRVTKGSSNVIIGLLDSGVQTDLEEIRDSVIPGWNFYDDSDQIFISPLDDYHGTNLASIIIGSHTGSPVRGVAPEARLLPLKFMRGTSGSVQDAVEAIVYAHSRGARIINISWDSTISNADLYDTMRWFDDTLFVCAAGKHGSDLSIDPVYPAAFELDNVISVAAIDNNGVLHELSGFGDRVHIAAPGKDILAFFPSGLPDYVEGTSIATAFVSGTAALALSANPDLTAVELAQLLIEGARKLDTLEGLVRSGGIVDAGKTVHLAQNFKN